MARWREKKQAVKFEDVPADLTGRARSEWLTAHGIPLVDYLDWLRSRRPEAGPPARRKSLTDAQRRELDEKREREGLRW
jgi:hypothetical protein